MRDRAAMSRLGTGQRSRIIVEHPDQIRPTVSHDFTFSCPHVERIVGEAFVLPFDNRNIWGATAGMLVNLAEVRPITPAEVETQIQE